MPTGWWLHGLQNIFLAPGPRGPGGSRQTYPKDDPETAQRVGHALIDRGILLENFPLLGAPYLKRVWIFYRANPEEGRVDIPRFGTGRKKYLS